MQDKKVAQVTSKATKPAPTKYFEAAKKNEVNEIKQLLKNSLNFKDDTKRRDIIKKVIAYMTLGKKSIPSLLKTATHLMRLLAADFWGGNHRSCYVSKKKKTEPKNSIARISFQRGGLP